MRPPARALALAGLAAAGLVVAGLAQAATITIVNKDGAGEGFNDATPFTPIGGNAATTLGQARLNVFNKAAQLWGALITSNVPIVVEATFDPLTCTSSSGTLGSAGPTWIYYNFPNAPVQNVYYPSALANALAGSRIVNDAAHATDISAQFNSSIGGDPNCLGNEYLYLGYDHQLTGHNDGRTYVADLLGVVLHELGHGLGFISLVDANGQGVADSSGTVRLGAYDQFVYDEGTGLYWKAMTDAQRVASGKGNAQLVFDGGHVNAQATRESAGTTSQGHVRLYSPATFDASSSVSHWDTSATPNLLMEPRYTLTTGSHADLTTCVLYDLGWSGSRCPDDLSAVAQSVTATAGSALPVTLGAANDNGAALTFTVTSAPAHGTLGSVSGSQVSYTPAAGYTGADSFDFEVSDALWTSQPATVSITVQAAATGGTGGGSGGSTGGTTTTAGSSGGGGGALGGWALLALALALAARAGPAVSRLEATRASRPQAARNSRPAGACTPCQSASDNSRKPPR